MAGGDLPTGNAIYNGMRYYDPVTGVGGSLNSATSPAFVINSGTKSSLVISPVPEPSTLAFLALGGAVLSGCRRSKFVLRG
jgi:hypothetical protein